MGPTEEEIGNVFRGILDRAEAEYKTMTEADLEKHWFFRYDHNEPIYYNMYLFYDAMSMYARSCQRWEEIHNGYVCVVERVRDKYIIPKIKEFEQIVYEKNLFVRMENARDDTRERIAAHEFMIRKVPRADNFDGGIPAWHDWIITHSFIAGIDWAWKHEK